MFQTTMGPFWMYDLTSTGRAAFQQASVKTPFHIWI